MNYRSLRLGGVNPSPVPILRRLLAPLICALCMLAYSSQAWAGCGDYLVFDGHGFGNRHQLESGALADNGQPDEAVQNGSLRILLPWQMSTPCDAPGCRQSRPQPESISTVVLDSRGPLSSLDHNRPGWIAGHRGSDCCFPHDDTRLLAVTLGGIFRPPLDADGCAL